MASIIKRKNKYSVVYYYEKEDGVKAQKWETWGSYQEALRRKVEIESQMMNHTFIAPQNQTVKEFLYDFVTLYGLNKWSESTYAANKGLIDNYINPLLGNLKMQSITPKEVAKYINQLQKTKPVKTKARKPRTELLTPYTIEKIHKLLVCAFSQAVAWEVIGKNPFVKAALPKTEKHKREIWTSELIRKALDNCTDSKLYLAMNLSFACSLRIGEILGLTWDNIHISEEEIAKGEAYLFVEKELARVSKEAMQVLNNKDIIKVFPTVIPNTHTNLVLKTPKTSSSVRKVWLPKTLAYILRQWKEAQEEVKEYLGEEYIDYQLVVAQSNGTPCDRRILEKSFARLKKEMELPDVVFHSLRHSSTTYKLKLNNGDLKATQGDTGHAQINMITDVYAHILDDDRKINAQKFEAAFYTNPDLRQVSAPKEKESTDTLSSLIEQLEKSPELADALLQILEKKRAKSD